MGKRKLEILVFSSKKKEGWVLKKKGDNVDEIGYEKTNEDIERIMKKRSRITLLRSGVGNYIDVGGDNSIIYLGWVDDRISYFPEELKLHILSLMPALDAARTSVLSKQWLHLWYRVGSLDFDFDCNRKVFRRPVYQIDQAMKCVGMDVEGGVSCWDKFRVRLDIGSDATNLDNWVRAALEKKVQILDLDLAGPYGTCYYRSPKVASYELLPPTSVLTHCFRLKALQLRAVRVDGETLEWFLHNCKILEELSVTASNTLISLRVGSGGCGRASSSSPPLSLKKLEIIYCKGLRQLDIHEDAKNLSCLKLLKSDSSVKYLLGVEEDVPSLSNLCISGDEFISFLANRYVPNRYLYNSSSSRSSTAILTRLQKLTLELHTSYVSDGTTSVPMLLHSMRMHLPAMSSLKQLCLIINTVDTYHTFLDYRDLLLYSCPFLQRLKLELSTAHKELCLLSGYGVSPLSFRKRKFLNVMLEHLKEIIIIGWVGSFDDPVLILDLVRMAGNLKKFTFDVRDPSLSADSPGDYSSCGLENKEFEMPGRLLRARIIADKLLPVGTEAEFLPHGY